MDGKKIASYGLWSSPANSELLDAITKIPGLVWEEKTADHTTSGSFGLLVGALKSAYAWIKSA